jgi:hypothetical protein
VVAGDYLLCDIPSIDSVAVSRKGKFKVAEGASLSRQAPRSGLGPGECASSAAHAVAGYIYQVARRISYSDDGHGLTIHCARGLNEHACPENCPRE